MQVHFHHLAHIIEQALRSARKEIKIAVCWFTHPDIFEAILYQCRRGIAVTLIINYDQLNIQPEGKLDFQSLIRAGGHFYGHTSPELMHHKFCVIDQRLLINGSFNWTQNKNRENILLTKESSVIQSFLQEFDALRKASKHFKNIDLGLVKPFQSWHLLEVATYTELALRKKIALGAQVWIYPLPKDTGIREEMSKSGMIGFKNKVLLSEFWSTHPYFDKNKFISFVKSHPSAAIEKATCRAWCLRLRPGDLVVCCHRRQQTIVGVGIIQSTPILFEKFYTGREINWIRDFSSTPIAAGFKIPVGLSLFRGSSFELVARLG